MVRSNPPHAGDHPVIPRTTNRISEYQARRAVALHHEETAHDVLIEARLRQRHGHHATGFKALLIRRALTQLATRTASNGGATLPEAHA